MAVFLENNPEHGIIIEETDTYIVLWKTHHIPAAPAGQHSDSLITRFVRKRPDLSLVKGYKPGEYGLLNRLDNDTAGVLLIAKTDDAFQLLHQAMKTGAVTKIYLAFCHNDGSEKKGVIQVPIAHHLKKKGMMVLAGKKPFRGAPQPCVTRFETITDVQAKQIWQFYLKGIIPFPDVPSSEAFTWIKSTITKGKRHQIRLHLAAAGYPIVGDTLYSPYKTVHLPFSVLHHQLYAVGIKLPAL